MNDTSYTVDFSDLRFNKYYVLVYNIAIRQLVTGENFGYFLYYRELMIIRGNFFTFNFGQTFSFSIDCFIFSIHSFHHDRLIQC